MVWGINLLPLPHQADWRGSVASLQNAETAFKSSMDGVGASRVATPRAEIESVPTGSMKADRPVKAEEASELRKSTD